MSELLELRDYQLDGVEGLREGFRDGHRSQILVAPTGAGKTVLAIHLMREARRKLTRSAFIVDRVALVDQTSAALDRFGVDHGVIQAGHWRNRMYEPIQVCSAQTLERRGFFPDLALLIVDEAHCVREQTAQFIQNQARLKVVGLTATPFTKGLGDLYTNLVNVSTTNKLVAEGFLVPLKMYAAVAADMTGAKVIAGEWSADDVEARGQTIIGDIVNEWIARTRQHFGGPVKTLLFSATVEHGAELCRQFQAAGYRFEQVSYQDANDERRRELIAEFRKADSAIVGLVSCEVLTKGFDVPDVLCGVDARPYRKSLSAQIQKMGRLMRPAPGKEFGLWLDHAGNCMRFLTDIYDVFESGAQSLTNDLDGKVRKDPPDKVVEQIRCGACKFIMPPRARVCPACGHEKPSRNYVETVPGQLIELDGKRHKNDGRFGTRDEVWRQIVGWALVRKKGDTEAARRLAQASYRNVFGEFARRTIDNTDPLPIAPQLESYLRSFMIRFAKSKHRAAA